mmetsp:Transcript_4237/g.11837  ORF Transcript_4237/g.11837 Transcript_4237/m.11837 type:complete len:310 (+) Transcript_4237:744-1673(+)
MPALGRKPPRIADGGEGKGLHVLQLRKAGGKVDEDLLGTAPHSGDTNFPRRSLQLPSFALSQVRRPPEDLGGLAHAKLQRLGALDFEERHRTTDLHRARALRHLVRQGLQRVLQCLRVFGHVEDLVANDLMVDEPLAERLALSRKLDRDLDAAAAAADHTDDGHETLAVHHVDQVGEPHTLVANEVLHRNLDVFKRNEGGVTGPPALGLQLLRRCARPRLVNHHEAHSRVSWPPRPDQRAKVPVRHTARDELLGTVDNVVAAARRLHGGGGDVGEVRPALGFCQGDAHALIATYHGLRHSTLQEVRSEL